MSNDAAQNWFLRFCTYCKDAEGAEPAQVRFDSLTWEASPDSVERDAEEIERYIHDMTGDGPYPVKSSKAMSRTTGGSSIAVMSCPGSNATAGSQCEPGDVARFGGSPTLGKVMSGTRLTIRVVVGCDGMVGAFGHRFPIRTRKQAVCAKRHKTRHWHGIRSHRRWLVWSTPSHVGGT